MSRIGITEAGKEDQMFGRMKDPVEGNAMLLSYELTNASNEIEVTIRARLMVEGPGLPPTVVTSYPGIRHSDLPLARGTTWRVLVDRRRPRRIRFLDDRRPRRLVVPMGMLHAGQLAGRNGLGPAANGHGAG